MIGSGFGRSGVAGSRGSMRPFGVELDLKLPQSM